TRVHRAGGGGVQIGPKATRNPPTTNRATAQPRDFFAIGCTVGPPASTAPVPPVYRTAQPTVARMTGPRFRGRLMPTVLAMPVPPGEQAGRPEKQAGRPEKQAAPPVVDRPEGRFHRQLTACAGAPSA